MYIPAFADQERTGWQLRWKSDQDWGIAHDVNTQRWRILKLSSLPSSHFIDNLVRTILHFTAFYCARTGLESRAVGKILGIRHEKPKHSFHQNERPIFAQVSQRVLVVWSAVVVFHFIHNLNDNAREILISVMLVRAWNFSSLARFSAVMYTRPYAHSHSLTHSLTHSLAVIVCFRCSSHAKTSCRGKSSKAKWTSSILLVGWVMLRIEMVIQWPVKHAAVHVQDIVHAYTAKSSCFMFTFTPQFWF